MIRTVFATAVRRLRHSRTEMLLTFVVPVVFFSIFAAIFGGGVGRTPQVRTLIADADRTDLSEKLMESLGNVDGLKTHTDETLDELSPEHLSVEAERRVRDGLTSAAVVLPDGLAERARSGRSLPEVLVLADSSNQVASQIVGAMTQQALARVVQEDAAGRRAAALPPAVEVPVPNGQDALPVRVVDVLGDGKANPLVASYAAGIAVLFLLFSASTAGGSLLEEAEAGTLERLLCSRLTMTELLAGKWVYIVVLGSMQTLVMFIWGQLVFGVDLVGHLPGFAVMTVSTAAAAASFALVLATACRSRTQLGGVSTILILSMSALGGSMVPRYLMSEGMKQWGLAVTFNAWSLDGFTKVFWRDQPIDELGPQVGVLVGSAAVLMGVARLLARRWETGGVPAAA